MRTWPALLLAPLLAMAHLSVFLAMMAPSCAEDSVRGVLLVLATQAVLAIVVASLTWRAWRELRRLSRRYGSASQPTDLMYHRPARMFVARLATASGALSLITMLGAWVPPGALALCWL